MSHRLWRRARGWFEQERQKAVALLEAGKLDQTGYEAALDRLQAQHGRRFTADDDRMSDQPVLVLDAVRDGPQVLVFGDPGTVRRPCCGISRCATRAGYSTAGRCRGSRRGFRLTAADPLSTDAGRGVLEFVDKADTHTGLLVE